MYISKLKFQFFYNSKIYMMNIYYEYINILLEPKLFWFRRNKKIDLF
jgi:hypothetical protein